MQYRASILLVETRNDHQSDTQALWASDVLVSTRQDVVYIAAIRDTSFLEHVGLEDTPFSWTKFPRLTIAIRDKLVSVAAKHHAKFCQIKPIDEIPSSSREGISNSRGRTRGMSYQLPRERRHWTPRSADLHLVPSLCGALGKS